MVDPEAAASKEELAGYRLWTPLRKARFFDRESRRLSLSREEEESAWAAFCKRYQVHPETSLPVPVEFAGCPPQKLREAVAREARVARWKELEFGPLVEAHFERTKHRFEKVVYSVVRVSGAGVARELWFRLAEGEATFAALAAAHGAGTEKFSGGIVGPVTLRSVQPELADRLRGAGEGELIEPFAAGGWHLVARLEKRLAPALDPPLRAALIEELAENHWEEHERSAES